MAGHTPGEWYLEVGCSERIAYIYPRSQTPRPIIAEIPLGLISGKAEGSANAQLIASSPELYESLKTLIRQIDSWEEAVENIIGRYPDTTWGDLEEARALVARIEQPKKREA